MFKYNNMKLLFVTFLAVFFSACCVSQIPQPNQIILNPNLDKFVGTWRWSSGTNEIIIQLKKVNYLSKDNIREDVLLGVHKYIFNGAIVEDHLSLFLNIGQLQKGTIFLFGKLNNVYPDVVTGIIDDNLKNKQNYFSLSYINGTIPKISWRISNLNGSYVPKNGIPQFDNSFTLPQFLILEKQ